MSVVVSISQSQMRRDRLISLRNGFTYVSSLAVLLLAALFFRIIDDKTKQFQVLIYVVTGLGVALSLFYIAFVGIQEARLTRQAQEYDKLYRKGNQAASNGDNREDRDGGDNSGRQTMSQTVKDWKGWLKEGAFYVHGGVYMFARLAMNLTMTAIPFYLSYVLEFQDPDQVESETPLEIALVPLCSYF